MSRENVEVVKRMLACYHAGDAEGALACFAPDVVTDASIRIDGGITHGREAMEKTISQWVGTFDDWREVVNEVRDVGDFVVVHSTQTGRGKGSGVELDMSYATLYQVEGGLITRMTIYTDVDEALEAIGAQD